MIIFTDRLSPPCWMLSNAMFGHQGAAEDPPDSLTLEQFDRLRKRQPQPPVSLFSHFYLNPNAPQAVPRRRRRRTAVNNGPIICTKCGSQYKTRKSLRAHIRIQCGKEPNFHCPLCPKKTYQKIHIEVHMSRVHKIGGWRYNEPIHNDWTCTRRGEYSGGLFENRVCAGNFKLWTLVSSISSDSCESQPLKRCWHLACDWLTFWSWISAN